MAWACQHIKEISENASRSSLAPLQAEESLSPGPTALHQKLDPFGMQAKVVLDLARQREAGIVEPPPIMIKGVEQYNPRSRPAVTAPGSSQTSSAPPESPGTESGDLQMTAADLSYAGYCQRQCPW